MIGNVNEGLGYVAIAQKLSEMNVLTRRDKMGIPRRGKKVGTWSGGTIGDILKNKTYAGTYTWGKTARMPFSKNDCNTDPADHIYVSVPPIISLETFEAAQKKMEENTRFNRRNKKHDYLLAGHMICPTCGYSYTGCSGRSRTDPNDKRYYYRCGSKVSVNYPYPGYQSPCPPTYVRAEDVDDYVWGIVENTIRNPHIITESLRENQGREDVSDIQIKSLEKEIQKLDAQRERLLGLYLEDALDKALLKQKAEELKQTRLSM